MKKEKTIPTSENWSEVIPAAEAEFKKLKDEKPDDQLSAIRVYLSNHFGFADPDELNKATEGHLDWFAEFIAVKTFGFRNIVEQGAIHPFYKSARKFKKQFDEAKMFYGKEKA